MIPINIDSNQITANFQMSLESIVDWFDQNKESFYTLGWAYLRNQAQMEELFYRVILKIHKELPRFKREASLEIWVTSIFIHMCREVSADRSLKASEDSEIRPDVFKALDQLKEDDKEAMVLTYVIGFSMEEIADILQVSVEEIKRRLFSGIQLLREKLGYGSHFDGCKENHKLYIDYLGRTLDRPEKVDFEVHIYHCQNCQEDLATFQEVMSTMLKLSEVVGDFHVPSGFMKKIRARLAEMEKRRQLKAKKQKKIGLVLAGVFVVFMCTGFLTGWFPKLYYTWTEEDQQLRAFLQHDLGKRLNLEAESDGVKIKIKSVIADDVQTLIFYEIEDMNEDNQYMMNYYDGVIVENENEIMNHEAFPKYYPPTLNNEEKNVYQGKMSLLPLTEDNGTIKLKVIKLEKLIQDPSTPEGFRGYGEIQYETGEWNFEIPVTKHPSIEYALDKELEIEGIPVQISKLTFAPTATIVQYGIKNEQPEKRIDFVTFDSLEVNKKKVKTDPYGNTNLYSQPDMNWTSFQAQFDPLFEEQPKEVNIQFGSIYFMIEDHKTIELDASKDDPQLFEYAGSTISIDKVEVGDVSTVVISDYQIKNRQYETFHFRVIGEDETEVSTMGMNSEGVLVDKSGKEYDINELSIPFEQLEQPRYFTTVQNIELFNDYAGKKVIPKKLDIYGYSTTKYVGDVVKILLD
ncbi:sigma-70 family RNA polymerase sigma factor [Cytobacillus sp. FJAT-53684]|uniref:Sigma-70 family RNA polymerase sigma factor n=1 Tax=Cytobacillus mangrovibacter TaxID=3299024 RepID=A0ABW6JVS2_9BACI